MVETVSGTLLSHCRYSPCKPPRHSPSPIDSNWPYPKKRGHKRTITRDATILADLAHQSTPHSLACLLRVGAEIPSFAAKSTPVVESSGKATTRAPTPRSSFRTRLAIHCDSVTSYVSAVSCQIAIPLIRASPPNWLYFLSPGGPAWHRSSRRRWTALCRPWDAGTRRVVRDGGWCGSAPAV